MAISTNKGKPSVLFKIIAFYVNGKIYQAKKSKFDIRLKNIQSCDQTKANR